MNDKILDRWLMQTARKWDDVAEVVRKTGVDFIDNDHKELTVYILKINNVIEKLNRQEFSLEFLEEQSDLLKGMYDYTEWHFTREEKFIRRFGFPYIEEQEREHKGILENLQLMIDDFNSGRVTVSMDVKVAAMDWVVRHINEVDYLTFQKDNWTGLFDRAEVWDDVSAIINQMDVQVIDDEHRRMTEATLSLSHLINSLNGRKPNTEDLKKIASAFDNLSSLASEHFQTEEELILQYGMPGYEEQKKQHQHFISDMAKHKAEVISGEVQFSHQLREEILDWWVTHINVYDHKSFYSSDWVMDAMGKASTWADVSGIIKNVGIEVIDNDHKVMTEIALELNQVISGEADRSGETDMQVVEDIFDRLIKFGQIHFQREEKIVAESYDGISQQKAQHKYFIQYLEFQKEHVIAGRLVLSREIKKEILQWWVSHVNYYDYKTFTNGWDRAPS